MIIKGGKVYQEDKSFAVRDLYIDNGRIVEDENQVTDNTVINAENMLVLPGLIDIHSHGAMGYDFSDGNVEGLKKILAYQYAHGITSYCPTTMTLSKEKLMTIYHTMKNWKNEKGLSKIVGLNMEGPFIDPKKIGAHNKEYICAPNTELFREYNKACGNLIRLITIAPNMGGAIKMIEELKEEVVISLGHSSADYMTAKAAFKAGASHVTHLFNAMSSFEHRAPGLVGAAAESKNCMAELICDGIHVHESTVRAAFKLFPDRIVLISDSMRATGIGNGTYDLGGQQVTVSGNKACLTNGTIAGSVSNLHDCLRNAVSFGIPLEDAVAAATMNPAKSIGIFHETGSLTSGKRADIIFMDKNLNILRIITS